MKNSALTIVEQQIVDLLGASPKGMTYLHMQDSVKCSKVSFSCSVSRLHNNHGMIEPFLDPDNGSTRWKLTKKAEILGL